MNIDDKVYVPKWDHFLSMGWYIILDQSLGDPTSVYICPIGEDGDPMRVFGQWVDTNQLLSESEYISYNREKSIEQILSN